MPKYRLRAPAISLLWMKPIEAKDETEAIEKTVAIIDSKTMDYSNPDIWEIEKLPETFYGMECAGNAGEGLGWKPK